MDWLLDVFATWLYGLKVIAITFAVIMFISGLDDFIIDVVYWGHHLSVRSNPYQSAKSPEYQAFRRFTVRNGSRQIVDSRTP